MNVFQHFKDRISSILAALAEQGKLPPGLDVNRPSCEPPKDPAHGDVATNAAMVLCKDAGMPPRALAEMLAEALRGLYEVTEVEVAGPGFINLRLAPSFWHDRLREVLAEGRTYGYADLGRGEQVNVEYVSANPTGPMHVGHARGAVFGDVLACLMEKMGYAVTREYYLNDAGAQVQALARSVYHRYRQALGVITEADYEALKASGQVEYGGDYLLPVAQMIRDKDEAAWLDKDEAAWMPYFRQTAVNAMVELIREDLAALGVEHAVFTSEMHDLIEAGKVQAAFDHLVEQGLIYEGVLEPPKGKQLDDWEPRPQTLFRATEFGDEVDRPLKKSDGQWTYFASDIAYHWDKFRRGFPTMIDVWGADHGGYVKRVQAAVKAVTEGQGSLDVKLCNMVKLMDQGQPVKMSKRAGTFVTLREVVDEVGKDVVRFIMLTRRNDQNLDFDLTKVTEQSRDNPVFYVQYAHARCCSVMRMAGETGANLNGAVLERLADPAEIALIQTLASWPRVLEGAAQAHEPHRLAYYLYELAGAFHGLWNKGNEDVSLRFLVSEDKELTTARLALVRGVANVIASGLTVFGVEPMEEMR